MAKLSTFRLYSTRIVSADGTAKGDDFIATSALSGDQTSPRIASYGDGFVALGYEGSAGVGTRVFENKKKARIFPGL